MTSDKSLGSSGTESRVHEKDCYFVTTYLTLGTHNGKKLTYLASSKTRQVKVMLTYNIIQLRTLLICGALERRRPETVHGALTRSSSSSIDLIDTSTL